MGPTAHFFASPELGPLLQETPFLHLLSLWSPRNRQPQGTPSNHSKAGPLLGTGPLQGKLGTEVFPLPSSAPRAWVRRGPVCRAHHQARGQHDHRGSARAAAWPRLPFLHVPSHGAGAPQAGGTCTSGLRGKSANGTRSASAQKAKPYRFSKNMNTFLMKETPNTLMTKQLLFLSQG